MEHPANLEPDQSANARFLASKERALASLRTPLRRYEKVRDYGKMALPILKLERASDVRGVSAAMHKDLVPAIPSKTGRFGHRVFDFKAADRGREMSKRIEAFCTQLAARIEREDEEFWATEPDHFTTPRVTTGMGG